MFYYLGQLSLQTIKGIPLSQTKFGKSLIMSEMTFSEECTLRFTGVKHRPQNGNRIFTNPFFLKDLGQIADESLSLHPSQDIYKSFFSERLRTDS